MFTQAIVRKPCAAMIHGLTEAALGLPDLALAQRQHQAYIAALESCGLQVTVLPADEDHPDSCFVEDPAIITPKGAVITRPGAPSRMTETAAIREALNDLLEPLVAIEAPGTLDGGDVMMVDDCFYIGLSARTNQPGAAQLISILQSWGLSGTAVTMNDMLHLKTGVSYLDNNQLLATGEFIEHPAFAAYEILTVPAHEAYAANSLWLNDRVLVPAGHPETAALIAAAGYHVLPVEVSEFQKLDGGLSCLSLRF
jgi:dimethylargininase